MKKNILISHNRIDVESIMKKCFSSSVYCFESPYIKKIEKPNYKMTIIIAEKEYLRIRSNLTLTIIAEETDNKTTVEVISSGGKNDIGFSLGAEKHAVKSVVKFLEEYGFAEQ